MKLLKTLNKSFNKSFKKFDTKMGLLLLACLGFIVVVYYCLKKQREAFNTDGNMVVYGGEERFDKNFDNSDKLPEILFNPDTHIALGYLSNNNNFVLDKKMGMIYKYNGKNDEYAGYYVCVFQDGKHLKLGYFTIENGNYTHKGRKYVGYNLANDVRLNDDEASENNASPKQKAYDKATFISQQTFQTVNTPHNHGLWPPNKKGILPDNRYRLSFIKVFKKDYIKQDTENKISVITKLNETTYTPEVKYLKSIVEPQIIQEIYTSVSRSDVTTIDTVDGHIEWFNNKVPNTLALLSDIEKFDYGTSKPIIIDRYYGFIKLKGNANKTVKLSLESDDASYLYIVPYDDNNFGNIFNTETEIITTENNVLNDNDFRKIDNKGSHGKITKSTDYPFDRDTIYLFIIYYTNSGGPKAFNFYIGNNVNASLKNNNDLEIIPMQNILDKNRNYRGYVSKTITGKTCQAWGMTSPHEPNPTVKSAYEYKTHGIGNHNYCRNPDNDKTIWCYTTDSEKRWEYCDIPKSEPQPQPQPQPRPQPQPQPQPQQTSSNNNSATIRRLQAQLEEAKKLAGENYNHKK